MGISVTIRGKEFPLCLTAAALDRINDQCGGIGGITDFLRGYPSEIARLDEKQLEAADVSRELWEAEKLEAVSRSRVNNAWMLGLLVEEGEENRLIEARFTEDGDFKRRAVPGPDEMVHLLTPGQAEDYRMSVLLAVKDGMKRTIETVPSKNVYQAGGR